VSTTVASASPVEAAATMASASAMEARSSTVVTTTTVVPAAYETMAASGIITAVGVASSVSFMSVAPTAAGITAAPTVTTPAAAIISAIPEPRRMTPVIPRARTNKHAAYEPIRPVIAVRRTGIRIIVIVPIRANRRTSRVGGTDPDPNADLRL